MTSKLLAPTSTGGAVARTGFGYQDAFVLQNLPAWLAQGAFSQVVSESIGDVEVCYFSLDEVRRRAYEAKDYQLTESQFWAEIRDFEAMHKASPSEYVEFVLVCAGFNSVVSPLVNKLERLRGVGTSYSSSSPIVADARDDIVNWIQSKGHDVAFAQFVIDRVWFMTFSSDSADTSFGGMVERHLPTIDLSGKQAAQLREHYKALIAQSCDAPVSRADLEQGITTVLQGDADSWLNTPTEVHLVQGSQGMEELALENGKFAGTERADRTPAEWAQLQNASEKVADFIKVSRPRCTVSFDGKQRMSLACVLGYAFSAVKGFTLAVRHNGNVYRTDDHSMASGPFFEDVPTADAGKGEDGVVCVGFPTPIGRDVASGTVGIPSAAPSLVLVSSLAITDIATLNQAVAHTKSQLVKFRSDRQLTTLHLFLKTPSFFAMVLGHRLNGLGRIQLYDWIDGRYVRTVVLS